MLNHAWTSHFNYVGDSIVGNNTNIAASTIFANIRLDFFDKDRKTIGIKHEEKFYDTGLYKFGGIFGDGSVTGCKVVINPCTFVGKNCVLGGLRGYKGFIADRTKIIDHLKD
jgi:bifunctional UDP-N-acetylglucosamine pyrophosphorylase/glucosamine-1-phosphate N-acetyltransferase